MLLCAEYLKKVSCNVKNLDELYDSATILYPKRIVAVKMYELFGYVRELDTNTSISQNTDYHQCKIERLTRPEQSKFRDALVTKYVKCIVSGYSAKMCEACHVEPYSKHQNNDPDNGLLLNRCLHVLFDSYLFTINADTLECSFHPKLIREPGYEDVVRYHGEKVDGLSQKTRDYLKEHNKQFDLYVE